MNIFTVSWWMLINLVILDVLYGLLQKNTRVHTYAKAPGLFALFILALTRQHPQLINQRASLLRFILSSCANIVLIISCFHIFKSRFLVDFNICLLLLMIMPFYYLLYALMGDNLLAVGTSIKNFRARIMIALVVASNCAMINIRDEINEWAILVHCTFILVALAHLFFFSSLPRSMPSFHDINYEDYDVAQAAFMNYLVSILDFFYYAILFYFVLSPHITSVFIINQPLYISTLIFFALLYLTSFVLAKILLVSRVLISTDLYENRLVPLSFLFFGMSYIYEIYF